MHFSDFQATQDEFNLTSEEWIRIHWNRIAPTRKTVNTTLCEIAHDLRSSIASDAIPHTNLDALIQQQDIDAQKYNEAILMQWSHRPGWKHLCCKQLIKLNKYGTTNCVRTKFAASGFIVQNDPYKKTHQCHKCIHIEDDQDDQQLNNYLFQRELNQTTVNFP